jgi:threonine aldolase
MLVGSKRLIDRARWFRKMIGGGWRQSGAIAAAADYAITHHFPRLQGTHELAHELAEGLREAGCNILTRTDTNMVFFDPSPLGLSTEQVCAALEALPDPISLTSNRCVLHHQTSAAAVDDFVREVKRLAGTVPPEAKGRTSTPSKLGYL